MKIKVVKENDKISIDELREIGREFYDDLVIGSVDIVNESVAFGGQYHLDARNKLIDDEKSKMESIWGFKLLLTKPRSQWLEVPALTDIRPGEGNPGLKEDSLENDRILKDNIRQIVEYKIA